LLARARRPKFVALAGDNFRNPQSDQAKEKRSAILSFLEQDAREAKGSQFLRDWEMDFLPAPASAKVFCALIYSSTWGLEIESAKLSFVLANSLALE
jgi:hypothetical protein